MAARVKARKSAKDSGSKQSHAQELAQMLAEDNASDIDSHNDDTFSFSVGRSVCSVNLGNRDLGHIVRGDQIEKRSFDLCF